MPAPALGALPTSSGHGKKRDTTPSQSIQGGCQPKTIAKFIFGLIAILFSRKHFYDNEELFAKVAKRQQLWKTMLSLEALQKDPQHLMKVIRSKAINNEWKFAMTCDGCFRRKERTFFLRSVIARE